MVFSPKACPVCGCTCMLQRHCPSPSDTGSRRNQPVRVVAATLYVFISLFSRFLLTSFLLFSKSSPPCDVVDFSFFFGSCFSIPPCTLCRRPTWLQSIRREGESSLCTAGGALSTPQFTEGTQALRGINTMYRSF
ncbi:hypothetical protein EDB85DRAFT_2010592 [Lactarius pseudohatsudake]|nr:hypothetical protein EDB85DRAFT_2010592 [Lactarius pseudohatsudake]